MKNCKGYFLIFCIATILSGCGVFDRADRLRPFEVAPGKKVGINVTDATRRLAVVYPDGRICSELSPPAVLEVDKAFVAGGEAAISGLPVKANIDSKEKTTAVKLATSTEAIECLRISLFNACSLAANNKLNAEQEVDLYKNIIQQCRSMSPINSENPKQ